MEFQWDEKKNESNITKHGFDFADGAELFQGRWPFLVAVISMKIMARSAGRELE